MSTLTTSPHSSRLGSLGERGAGAPTAGKLVGLLVEFDHPKKLIAASEQVRDAGYTRWDTHTPYPVHHLEHAMGVRTTRLPYFILCCGLIGAMTGLGMQLYMNSLNPRDYVGIIPTFLQSYDYWISGKPQFSIPANIPVMFELTVLFSAFGAVFGMLGVNGLPMLNQALLRNPRFRRATSDRFFIRVDVDDPKFDTYRTTQFLESLGGSGPVERVEDFGTTALPLYLKWALAIATCFALIPPALAYRSWFSKSAEPRIHIIQDMDNQERFKSQQPHPLFNDGRSSRLPVLNTVARGDAKLISRDAHYFEGKVGGKYVTTFPPQILAMFDEEFVERGQARFNIYCAPCHGYAGYGDGMVNRRAVEKLQSTWVNPGNLHDDAIKAREVGYYFHVISNGIRTMPAYADQIPEDDRWAITAYIRALQRSQATTPGDVPAEQLQQLKERK